MAYQGIPKVKNVMVQPMNLIFRFIKSCNLDSIKLHDTVNTRMEGVIIGFDEYIIGITKNSKTLNKLPNS